MTVSGVAIFIPLHLHIHLLQSLFLVCFSAHFFLDLSPTDEAADLIEYVQALRDMSHLNPRGLGLPFYRRYMLDVLLLIGVALALFLAIFIRLIQLVVKICLGVTRKTKTS